MDTPRKSPLTRERELWDSIPPPPPRPPLRVRRPAFLPPARLTDLELARALEGLDLEGRPAALVLEAAGRFRLEALEVVR